jgi:UDP-N-acetylglucosamine 2-epimerase (non-hydrolysing)
MIYLIGGARPNFMKIAALSRAFDSCSLIYEIIHTGQHYDSNMDEIFFKELCIKAPLVYLKAGSGNHGEQTAKIMYRFEKLCLAKRPNMIFTVGDVNSTMAAALVGAKLHIPVAHQEAGMRSGDMKMPEEINRIVTDHISDYLFPISFYDRCHLISEGIQQDKIFTAGDVMIDNLLYYSKNVEKIKKKKKLILVEIHRPANVDNHKNLIRILYSLERLAREHIVLFPIHPRTRKMILEFGMTRCLKKVTCIKPMGYFNFLKCMVNADAVITDSDGIQQETSVLDIPCVSIRDTSNIFYTVQHGTNYLVNPLSGEIMDTIRTALSKNRKHTNFPKNIKELNDGNASNRIAKFLLGRI